MNKKIIKEKLRLKLISWIAELITEWKGRDKRDKGTLRSSDKSDLVIDLACKIDKFYKKEMIEKIEKIKPKLELVEGLGVDETNYNNGGVSGYNRAKKEIINLIKDERH